MQLSSFARKLRHTVCAAAHVHDSVFSGDHVRLKTAKGGQRSCAGGMRLIWPSAVPRRKGELTCLLPLQQRSKASGLAARVGQGQANVSDSDVEPPLALVLCAGRVKAVCGMLPKFRVSCEGVRISSLLVDGPRLAEGVWRYQFFRIAG